MNRGIEEAYFAMNKLIIFYIRFIDKENSITGKFQYVSGCVFSRAVLEMQWSDGLHDMGYPKWQLVLCLVIVYATLYISLFKGVKSSGIVTILIVTFIYFQ